MSHHYPPVGLLPRCEACLHPHIPLPMFPHRGQCSCCVASMEDCRLAQPERHERRPRPILHQTSAVAWICVEGATFPHGPPQNLTFCKIAVSSKYTGIKNKWEGAISAHTTKQTNHSRLYRRPTMILHAMPKRLQALRTRGLSPRDFVINLLHLFLLTWL